jgi:flagellar biosynthesis GTPase FlhF
MRARHFRAPTLLEAVRRAKAALGPDAVIVGARRISSNGWLRRAREAGFELEVRPPVRGREADALVAEMRRLEARLESFAASLEATGRLAEELAALRRAVEALGRPVLAEVPAVDQTSVARVRSTHGARVRSTHGARVRSTHGARVRLAPDGVGHDPDSTPGVRTWN